jgi:hypothetical protein
MQDKSGKDYLNYFAAYRFIVGLFIFCGLSHSNAHVFVVHTNLLLTEVINSEGSKLIETCPSKICKLL